MGARVQLRTLPNISGLLLAVLGSLTLAWVALLTWYDTTAWGKDLNVIFFGSRTGENISLGIGMKVVHYSLIGLALLFCGLLILLRRRNVWAHGNFLRKSRTASSGSKGDPKDKKKTDKKSEQTATQYLTKTVEDLRKEKERLAQEKLKSGRKPSGRIGFTLLAIGVLTLAGSIVGDSTVLAFIGIGLTFWGALFLFARPIKFVRSTLLDSTASSSYVTIDRMIQDLDCKGKPIYIPPYAKEAYLPEYLKGLKEMIVFISAKEISSLPTIEEMAEKKFLLENPEGICIAPPGNGLINLIERELRVELTRIDIERLYSSLPTVIAKDLELAKEFEINTENDFIHTRIVDSVYKNLYSWEQDFKSVHSIGCPLTSAIACALAKTTAKLVTIVKDAVSPDLRIIDVWYKTLEA